MSDSIDTDGDDGRTLGLGAATGIGVGAIVGGGIFVLAGVAYATAGPSAIVAFALNGMVAFLTAMSFAEISSAFPENGGAYTFAKNILSVRAAFATGWILWSAYIVAGVLYALGFASFASLSIYSIWDLIGSAPDWLHGRHTSLLLASLATVVYAYSQARKTGGGAGWATTGKVIVFGILLVAGLAALLRQDIGTTTANVTPFFDGGSGGVLMAMGFTFIALQGFDLIAAVGGEVKRPSYTIPRAMFLSLGCALAIYLPLLFMVASVGVVPGESISALAAARPESVIPLAAERFMGPAGYWLVLVAALLSTLSALNANLLAASRIALAMAQDRTLPAVLGDVHIERRTPVVAIYATALTLIAIVFMVPNLTDAGAAASLIFLVSFALTHFTGYLARKRGGTTGDCYRTPWFPMVPIVGGLACTGLAVFQGIVSPDATGIVMLWLALGVMLYWSLFARRAEIGDAASEGFDPSILSMRGRSPLVLVPIANPKHVQAMTEVANALARNVWRVLLLSIVPIPEERNGESEPIDLRATESVITNAMRSSYASGDLPEALITFARAPLDEIRRVAEGHQCQTLLLGLGDIEHIRESELESLLNDVDADVAFMRTQDEWTLAATQKILVPVGGLGDQHELRARLLSSVCRSSKRDVTFVTVLSPEATEAEAERVRRDISKLADLKVPGISTVNVIRAKDATAAIIEEAEEHDLMVLGLQSVGRGRKVFGDFVLRIAREAPCATIFLSRQRPKGFQLLDPLRDEIVDSLRNAWAQSPGLGRGDQHEERVAPERPTRGTNEPD
ncbi:MAG: amino acid permease [Myxococcales bacterium]|nr:amino acid permease [Myxococcales bacterium]